MTVPALVAGTLVFTGPHRPRPSAAPITRPSAPVVLPRVGRRGRRRPGLRSGQARRGDPPAPRHRGGGGVRARHTTACRQSHPSGWSSAPVSFWSATPTGRGARATIEPLLAAVCRRAPPCADRRRAGGRDRGRDAGAGRKSPPRPPPACRPSARRPPWTGPRRCRARRRWAAIARATSWSRRSDYRERDQVAHADVDLVGARTGSGGCVAVRSAGSPAGALRRCTLRDAAQRARSSDHASTDGRGLVLDAADEDAGPEAACRGVAAHLDPDGLVRRAAASPCREPSP